MKTFNLLKPLGAMALGLFITITATPAVAKNSNPGVLPPGSTPKGLTYGEWSAQWGQWALGILAEMNPLLDGTGEFCDVDQSGSVWFLAGIFGDTGGTNVRECTIPPGKMLFFPVINSVWITTCLNEPRTQDGIRPLVAPFIDAATGLAVEVDGVPLQNLEQYRVESPLFCTPLDLYGIETAEDLEAADICPAGESVPVCYTPNPDELFGTYDGFGPAMADGYWIMLAPLSVGEHTIQFDARSGDFVLNITYYLTIGRE